MNTTAPKKTHIYAVAISHVPKGDVAAQSFVRAESMSQARNFVANSMLTVDRATTEQILDLKREDVIDATAAPDQQALPLPTTTEPPEKFGVAFIEGITNPEG